jgi:hypothetical protein
MVENVIKQLNQKFKKVPGLKVMRRFAILSNSWLCVTVFIPLTVPGYLGIMEGLLLGWLA